LRVSRAEAEKKKEDERVFLFDFGVFRRLLIRKVRRVRRTEAAEIIVKTFFAEFGKVQSRIVRELDLFGDLLLVKGWKRMKATIGFGCRFGEEQE
jgi:hypothetical protein